MKTIVIGDIHGKDIWKEIVGKEIGADHFVFIGDYVDSFTIPFKDQLDNLKGLFEFKRKNRDNVTLLIGNHDYHYFPWVTERYSGHAGGMSAEIFGALYSDAMKKGLLDISYEENNYLFTHAGVTKTWLKNHQTIPMGIDFLFENNPQAFGFYGKDSSRFGNNVNQSPIWVRPEALISDFAPGYTQVVGHTHQTNIKYYEGDKPIKLIMVDCLDEVNEYLIIEDGVPKTGKL